jgi:hypothetical protein
MLQVNTELDGPRMLSQVCIAAFLLVASGERLGQARHSTSVRTVLPVLEGDGYQGVIFPVPPYRPKKLGADAPWTPTATDVREFEKQLPFVLKDSLRDPQNVLGRKEDIQTIIERLSRYRRQYAGVATGKRTTLIVNFIAEECTHPSWRQEWVRTRGGGTSHWGISFDVTENRFHSFHANGPK